MLSLLDSMWKPTEITTSQSKMDFTSSGQEVRTVTQLYFDDMLFCNGIELVQPDADTVQFIVCDHCGYAGCSSGNWLTIRKLGDLVIFIPSFESMEDGERELSEYQAPYQIRKRGAVYLEKDQFEVAQSYLPDLPGFDCLEEIKNREIALLVQFEAPFRVLGEFPDPIQFRKDLYLATTSELEDGIIPKLEELMNAFYNSMSRAQRIGSEEDISIFLDGSDLVEWKPICTDGSEFYVKLSPNIGLKA